MVGFLSSLMITFYKSHLHDRNEIKVPVNFIYHSFEILIVSTFQLFEKSSNLVKSGSRRKTDKKYTFSQKQTLSILSSLWSLEPQKGYESIPVFKYGSVLLLYKAKLEHGFTTFFFYVEIVIFFT